MHFIQPLLTFLLVDTKTFLNSDQQKLNTIEDIMKETLKIALSVILCLCANLTAALNLSFASETTIDSTILKSQRNLLIQFGCKKGVKPVV